MPRRLTLCLLIAVSPLVVVAPAPAQPVSALSTATAAEGEVVRLPEAQVDGSREESAWSRLWHWSDARLRGVFDVILPDTQERRTWRLTLQPHFRDVINSDYLRLPTGLIYGFNQRAEGEIGLDNYLRNPFKDATRSGVANIRTNFKYRWTPPLDSTVSAASGFAIVRPMHHAPEELNEGVNRYSVYTTFARPSPTIANLEGFLNLSYDFITGSSAVGNIPLDQPQDDFVRVATGVLYRRGPATWGLAFAEAHTIDGDTTNFFSITPSLIYDVPPKYTFRSPGLWQVGAAFEALRHGNENEATLRVRVRWSIDFKKAMRSWRHNGRTGNSQ